MRVQLLLLFIVVAFSERVSIFQEFSDEFKAVEKIALLGGKIETDDTLPPRPVVGISFDESVRFNDNYMHLLKEFKQLTHVNLRRSKITDAGLSELREIKGLTVLRLDETAITGAGLNVLKDLTKLTSLNLGNSKINDAGLKELSEVISLTTFVLFRHAKRCCGTDVDLGDCIHAACHWLTIEKALATIRVVFDVLNRGQAALVVIDFPCLILITNGWGSRPRTSLRPIIDCWESIFSSKISM